MCVFHSVFYIDYFYTKNTETGVQKHCFSNQNSLSLTTSDIYASNKFATVLLLHNVLTGKMLISHLNTTLIHIL